MVQSCSPVLINNTITQNRCTSAYSTYGGGLSYYSSGSYSGLNNIICYNYAQNNPEIFGTASFNYSCSPVTLPGTGNITSNPQFADTANNNFNLLATSPCIDTGDPSSPLDPDGTRADMGALYYYHQVNPPNLDITLTPTLPPPPVGLEFDVSVVNNGPNQVPFQVWSRDKFPNGTYTSVLMGPVQIFPPVGLTITRHRIQSVPSTWPAGTHTYLGYVNTTFSYPAIDSSFFTWTKLTGSDGGPEVANAFCYGEPFPGEVLPWTPPAFNLAGAYPNPFNPVTEIRYQVPETGRVSLKVYDSAGRLVATLVDGWREAGSHQVTFDGSRLASGMYLYTLTAGTNTATGKLMLVK